MSPARLDLAKEFRCRRWRRLLNVIDQLPRDSRFAEAQANDEELAVEYLKQKPDAADPKPPRLSEYGPVVERLDVVIDRLGSALVVLGGLQKPPQPQPRPVVAFERIKHRNKWVKHAELVARVLPKNRT